MEQSNGSRRQDAEVEMRHWPVQSWAKEGAVLGANTVSILIQGGLDLPTSISGVKGPQLWVLGCKGAGGQERWRAIL